MSRPEKPLGYDDLPDDIKTYLFNHHEHDKKGRIYYMEEDVIRLIYSLISGTIKAPEFPKDRI